MGRDDPQDTWALTCNGREGAEKEEQGVMRGERKQQGQTSGVPSAFRPRLTTLTIPSSCWGAPRRRELLPWRGRELPSA